MGGWNKIDSIVLKIAKNPWQYQACRRLTNIQRGSCLLHNAIDMGHLSPTLSEKVNFVEVIRGYCRMFGWTTTWLSKCWCLPTTNPYVLFDTLETMMFTTKFQPTWDNLRDLDKIDQILQSCHVVLDWQRQTRFLFAFLRTSKSQNLRCGDGWFLESSKS